MSQRSLLAVLAAALATLNAAPALACASCSCALSSDWESQGYTADPGWRLDLRYDYINQNELRSGSGKVNRAAFPPGPGQDHELEQVTTNRYFTVAVDYSPNKDWGFNAQIPYVDRFHQTITPGETAVSESDTNELGDIRLTARYQGFSAARNIGVSLGLKLPTGEYKQNFSSGPEAGGQLDRGLQAGTGTTDLLLGAFRFGALNRDWDWFAQVQYQHALSERDGYRPGDALNLSGGLRYVAHEGVTPELQLNVQHRRRDEGANADVDNSGGTITYLSPGLSVAVSKQARLYGFVQLPIHYQLEGLQLAPRWTATVGARVTF